jgi:hypothetical protein
MTSAERELLVCALALHKIWRNQEGFEVAKPIIENFKRAATLVENENEEVAQNKLPEAWSGEDPAKAMRRIEQGE